MEIAPCQTISEHQYLDRIAKIITAWYNIFIIKTITSFRIPSNRIPKIPNKSHHERSHTMSTLKNGEFGIDLDKEKILWTDRKRHTIFSLPLSFTKYTLTETKLIIQRGCFNLREDEIQLYRVRDIAFKQNFYERLCRVGSIHLCSTDAMTPEIDIRRIKNPRDVKEVLSKTIEACRKANGIRTSEIIGDHGRFPEPDPHGMPPEHGCEHSHD